MMFYSRKMVPIVTGFVLWMIIMFGVVTGAAAGYEAESLEETQIIYDGEYIHYNGESDEVGFDWEESNDEIESVQPWYVNVIDGYLPEFEQTSAGEEIEKGFQTMADQMLWASMWILVISANISGVFFYFLSPIVPMSVTQVTLQVISYIPILALLYFVFQEYSQTIKQVMG